MDFERVIDGLLAGFDRLAVRYAVIGGFALGARGVQRATSDLDFLIDRDDMPKVHELLVGLGYARVNSTENVSQYDGALGAAGFIDVIHAFRPLAREMLRDAEEIPVLGGARKIRVVRVEDLVGLKAQAIAGDPSRVPKDMADVEALLALHRAKADWERIRRYFDLFELSAEFERLRGKYGDG